MLTFREVNRKHEDELISKYFTIKEAFYLPRWKRLAEPKDGLSEAAFETVKKFLNEFLDPVREFMDSPMIVHCCYRPVEYNKVVGGAARSAHLAIDGHAAMDFHFKNFGCDYARSLLVDHLEAFGLRMEDKIGAGWLHLDNRPVPPGGKRFFLP